MVASAMKKKYLNTLIALALLAALWGAATYWEKRKSETSEKETQEKIVKVEKGRILSISLEQGEEEMIVCRREGDKWVIEEPRKLPADQSAIDSLLTNLTDATVNRTVEPPPTDLKDFGLDQPATTLEVSTDAKPEKLTLLLGDETPTGAGVYAQLAGDPRVVILPRYLKTSLSKTLFDLRDHRAFTLDADKLLRIEAAWKGKRWTLEKNPQGAWNLVLPPAVRADHFTASGLVDRLRSVNMQSIVAETQRNLGRYGFGAPQLRLQASGPEGSQTLTVGKKEDGNYFATNSALDPVFTLDSGFVSQFQKQPDDLRDKDLFAFSNFEAKRVEVEGAEGTRVFEREAENKWKQTAPAAKEVATDKLETLLNRLRDLRAESFPKGTKLDAFGLSKPAYRFKVRFGDKNEEQIVEASKVAEHAYARRGTDALACEVSKTALEDVEKALQEL